MALSGARRANVERLLTAYCAPSPNPRIRRWLRHGFVIRGNAVVLYSESPALDRRQPWVRLGIAKFNWVAARLHWELLCQHSDLRWHRYLRRPASRSFKALLAEVEHDPTGIFWG